VLPGAAASKTGHTYGQLSAAWWQYVFSIPANPPAYTPNPLFDETGINCGVGQSASSPVFFLVGVFNLSNTATRTKCTVPAGKFLFFPMLNAEADNALATTELKQSQLITCAAQAVNSITQLQASIDGVSVTDPFDFRTKVPAFRYTFPAMNNLSGITCSGTRSPTCDVSFPGLTCTSGSSSTCTAAAAGDGYYLLLKPLSPGNHTISFGGSLVPNFNFTLDVTYNPLTVQ